MERQSNFNLHKTIESEMTSHLTFDWKLQAGPDAPVNLLSPDIWSDSNRKIPAFADIINPLPSPLADEGLRKGTYTHETMWSEPGNVIAGEDMPPAGELHVLLFKTTS